ncbi:hypothetical protein [Yersinia pseudotuberculosis]|uniref:hypothetical protein n=1 Tax=Yersinia pseudotuberculosis TaxID=633 RepID=UPI0005DEF67F|nr:hypothetical protein [Yersinia pseudotuberculosis]CFV21290.1 Uncharacterised protein [Yersinia pseudotuberculosis]
MAWLYISLSVVSLFFYYYVVSHLLYSKNIYLNISSLAFTCLFSIFHYSAFISDRIPLFGINTENNDFLHYITILFSYSYAIPFIIAYKKFYNKK